MKKKVIIVSAVFVFFLAIGLWYNLTPGRYFSEDFWRLKDGAYTAWSGDSIRQTSESEFALNFAGKDLTASLSGSDEGYRVDFSDGWAVELGEAARNPLWVEVGGVIFTGETAYVLTDMEAADLRFVPAKREAAEPFYDENGNAVGESRYIELETGESVGWTEVWYDNPEYTTPEQETVVLREGMSLKYEDFHQKLFVNEAGEYLANAADKYMMQTSGNVWRSRSSVAAFLVRIAGEEPGRRGDIAVIFLYAFIYLLGAANFLWPEQLAFFGHRWQYRNEPELSDEGLFMAMLGAIVIMAMAVVILFIRY